MKLLNFIAALLSLTFIFSEEVLAGSYFFAGIGSERTVTHPMHYSGSGISIQLGVCIREAGTLEAEPAVRRAIATWNQRQATVHNIKSGNSNDIPSGKIDLESVILHELGHCLGLEHPNLGDKACSDLCPDSDFTTSTTGPNLLTRYDLGPGADSFAGTKDDQRGNDANLHWFYKGRNDPFSLTLPVDSTNYTIDLAALPAGHSFASNGNRTLALLNGILTTQAVMHQGIFEDEAIRTLTADDVATLLFAATGLDSISSTSDDYEIGLYFTNNQSLCDIPIRFGDDISSNNMAQCTVRARELAQNHRVITEVDLTVDDSIDWYAGDSVSSGPSIQTLSASSLTSSSAILNLAVNPNGSATSVWFEWGLNANLGEATAHQNIGAGSSTIPVSASLSSLICDTTYYFRAMAQNSFGGSITGDIIPLRTSSCSITSPPQPIEDPSFESGNNVWWAASPAFYISNTFTSPHTGSYYAYFSKPNGTRGDNLQGGMISQPINIPTNTTAAELRFWYGVVSEETTTSTVFDTLKAYLVRPGNQLTLLSTISNLDNSGTQYREKRINISSSFFGQQVQIFFAGFTNGSRPTLFRLDDVKLNITAPSGGSPAVTTLAADEVTTSAARLNMSVNPNGVSTEVWFNFEAEDDTPNTDTDHFTIGGATQNNSVRVRVTDLRCGTRYYFQANARNVYSLATGTIRSFSTPACATSGRPQVTTQSAGSQANEPTRAILNSIVNPNGATAYAHFEWGPDTSYGLTHLEINLGAGLQDISFPMQIENLLCGVTYHFRIVAHNSYGTTTGSDRTFTTPACLNVTPTLSLVEPDGLNDSADTVFMVTWLDSDPDSNALISLGYSSDSSCTAPASIVTNISEDGASNSYTWNTSSVPSGRYFIQARIDDGIAPAVTVCSVGAVSINHAATVVRVLSQGVPGTAGKDIWTTSVFAYTPVQGGPGGGLDDDQLRVGGWGDSYYSLIEFDLAGLPQYAQSARIDLFPKEHSGATAATALYLDRIADSWDWRIQGTGSDHERLWWVDRPGAVQWRSGALSAPTFGAWYSIDITDLYNAWQAGTYPNRGIQLRPVSTNNAWSDFYSSGVADPDFRPRIVVDPGTQPPIHPMIGLWRGTIAGYASELTIEQGSGAFSARISMDQANDPVEQLTIGSVTETTFLAYRPADHNAALQLSLTQSGAQQCLVGSYVEQGSSRPISLCKVL